MGGGAGSDFFPFFLPALISFGAAEPGGGGVGMGEGGGGSVMKR